MTDKERLVETMKNSLHRYIGEYYTLAENLADDILADGWMRVPCKVGDMVYVQYFGEIVNAYVTKFEINSKGIVVKTYIDPDTYREYDADEVYFTREEAEKALRGGESDA